jgi:hypothetical protein
LASCRRSDAAIDGIGQGENMTDEERQTAFFLAELLEAAQEPSITPMSRRAAQQFERLIHDGGIIKPDLESLLEALDPRLRPHYAGDANRLLPAFGLSWRELYFQPVGRKDAHCFLMLTAADVVLLLSGLERCGFATDASPLATAIILAIKKKILVDRSELRTLRFPVEQRSKTLVTTVPKGALKQAPLREERVLPSGHKVRLFGAPDGLLQRLEFFAPGRRNPRSPHSQPSNSRPALKTCSVCGVEYVRGLPKEQRRHRKHHLEYVSCSDPQPHEKLRELGPLPGLILRVDSESPAWMLREMYLRARMLKDELGYGLMWRSPNLPTDTLSVGYLMIDNFSRILGAYAFRPAEADGTAWILKWVWIAPPFRRLGLLSAAWPRLRQEFGSFKLEKPLSDAMSGFLRKEGLVESGNRM